MTNRTLINNFIVEELKKIDGGVSPFDPSYIFTTNLHTNVFRGLRYIDEINDFPSIYSSCSKEIRTYNTKGNTEAEVPVILRCYVHGEEPRKQTSDLVSDIEHVIYNMNTYQNLDLLIKDITMSEIQVDSGLLDPYGMAEVFITVRFELPN